ncbi:SusD/RagB family nutrient-binding outer membrane lipoprotein [Hymenobacter ginsengisoli]|uniref:SusD/RagB family nutrient-binding outer membrane lipoprotein n=1 Tax=Hymenobacter ginsengisoli TaxID=1051626 RepID=A0ABP8PXX8_9BACT|nr:MULTISPECIES: SusD/RagB family nutrient-binding outer membrane lipoprotein [unclassified Hymenobacter]MBO2030541.1 SusD/RagB family nutrient-binding outer membrane lipoprotein [Hymenobacter sp. BT559]
MNTFSKVLLAATLTTAASSCKSFLDVNTNPNSATAVTPAQLLANAETVTAANYTSYNAYGSFAAGYWGKSNAVSGYNEERTYNYSSTYYQGLWSNTFDNIEDYRLIRTNAMASSYPNHVAIARIMEAYNFLLLVDEYGDIPYTTAVQGLGNTQPTFDKQQDIYKDLVVQLKGAVTDINAATSAAMPSTEDVIFRGNMNKWKAFANSLRLRILLRESSTNDATLNAYVKTEMALLNSPDGGFITTDVLVQPGYAANSGQQNPFYNTYGFAVGTTNTTSTYKFTLPTKYFINLNQNLSDPRVTQQYMANKSGAYVGTNLGEKSPPSPVLSATSGSTLLVGGDFLRGANQPTPLMLLAEHLFSKSEAEYRGLLSGDAQADYTDGIRASFQTTYRTSTTSSSAAPVAPTPQSEAYLAANVGNGLVDWAATTTPQTDAYGNITSGTRTVSTLEKIITQKWIAEAVWGSIEAWDDFRRTGFPIIPISLEASSGKFPSRLFYPQSELNTNAANVPTGVTQYTKIFWAQQ